MPQADRRGMTVALFVPPEAAALDLALAAETLRLGSRMSADADYRLHFVAEGRAPGATSLPGLWVHPARSAAEPPGAIDTLVVLGGEEPASPSPVALHWLSLAAATARRCAGVGAGAFLLGATGSLDGRRATTATRLASALAERYPRTLVDARGQVVRDGTVLTCGGGASTAAMMVDLIREDAGAETAARVAAALALPSALGTEVAAGAEGAIERVAAHVRAYPGADHRLPDLAARAAMSERTFTRLFPRVMGMSSAAYVRQVRVDHARRLLEGTDLPIRRVLHLSGFQTGDAGRRAFEQIEGMSPSAYRRLRRPADAA